MFKRLTRKQFARIIEPFAQQRTKNEKIWYDELYKLNNRIANAQKKGYQFTAENVIPKTPSRITQKAIDYLTSIRGTKLYSKADNPINPIVSDAEQYRVAKELAKNEKPYEAKAKDESQAIVSSLGKQKEDNTKTPAYTRDIEKPSESTVSVEPVISDYDVDNEPVQDTITGDTDYDKEFYDRNKEYQAEFDEPIQQYRQILDNIYDELGAFEYRIQDVPMYHDENALAKSEAALSISKMLNGAIAEYGEQEVARRLNDAGKEVSDLVERALYYVYKNVNRTSEITNTAINRIRDILFEDDAEAKMKYDFRDLYDI